MIKSLIGVLMLSSSMSLKMPSQNVIYDQAEDNIILSAEEVNTIVFENLFNAFDFSEEDDSIIAQDTILYYNDNSFTYMDGLLWEGEVGEDFCEISLGHVDYKFHLFSMDLQDDIDFEYSLRISTPYYSDLAAAIQLDVPEPEPTPTPSYSGLYGHVYDFFYGLFDNEDLNAYHLTIMSVDTTLSMWLAHSVSILLLCLGVLWLILVVRWIFRVFSGLIKI